MLEKDKDIKETHYINGEKIIISDTLIKKMESIATQYSDVLTKLKNK